MRLVDILNTLDESKKGDGTKVYTSREGTTKETHKARKGRVKTYASIRQALGAGAVGSIFSTKAADRLYVISKGKWGAKSGRGKIAKGFTPGSSTPGSSFSSIKKHAARTKLRHGTGGTDALAQKYGSRSIKKKRGLKTESYKALGKYLANVLLEYDPNRGSGFDKKRNRGRGGYVAKPTTDKEQAAAKVAGNCRRLVSQKPKHTKHATKKHFTRAGNRAVGGGDNLGNK
jgi:hypothetical protein